jgi:hypothetical protein
VVAAYGVMAGLVPAIHVLRVVSLWMPATSAGMTAQRAVSSAEEHFLDMEGVRGSIPLPPTIDINALDFFSGNRAHVSPMKTARRLYALARNF